MKEYKTQVKHYFFDTSALVKRFHEEKGTKKVDEIYDNPNNQIVISETTLVELPSALKKKLIEGKIDKERLNTILQEFFSDVAARYVVLSLDEKVLHQAIRLVLEEEIRTLDSIQLSFCLDYKENIRSSVYFVCADKNLIKLSKLKGLNTLNPQESEEEII